MSHHNKHGKNYDQLRENSMERMDDEKTQMLTTDCQMADSASVVLLFLVAYAVSTVFLALVMTNSYNFKF